MATALLALVALAASPAPVIATALPAPTVRFALSGELQTHWRLDRGYQAFARERNASASGVSLSYDVMRLAERGTLASYVAFRQGRSERLTQGGPTFFDERTAEAGAIFRLTLRRWLEPHLRLGAQATWVDARLGLQDGTALSAQAFSPGLVAGAGFRVRTGATRLKLPGSPAVAAAAVIEGGFAAAPPLQMSLRQPEPDDKAVARDRIDAAPVDAGTLDRAQPYVRLSLSLLF